MTDQEKKPPAEVTPFDQQYYDAAYFDTASKRMVDKNTGKETVWGYQGTDWSGNYHIVQALLKIFEGELGSVLDVGCGKGSFIDHALRAGMLAKGYDFSEYAIKDPHNYARGHIFQADVSEGIKEEDLSFDLVFCSDMLEHIKKSKAEFVVKELLRISRKYVFLQFPVIQKDEEVFNAEVHDKSHPLYTHFMIAGHLNMEYRSWWDTIFSRNKAKIREDLVVAFREVTPRAVIANWFNIVILEK